MKDNWKSYVLFGILVFIIGFLVYKIFDLNKDLKYEREKVEYVIDSTATYVASYKDEEINDLKKRNEELYIQVKDYKKEIDYLVQFTHNREYTTDTVYVQVPIDNKDEKEVKVFEYKNEQPTDSLNYKLQIGSTVEPNWYKLDISLSDEYTIINRRDENGNTTTITPSNGGTITDVDTFHKNPNNFWDRIAIGPSLSAGYDFINNKGSMVVGVSVVYDLTWKKKQK